MAWSSASVHRRPPAIGSSPRVRGTLCGPPSCDGASLETAARDGPRRRRPLRIATPLRRRRLIVPVAHDGLRHRPVPRGPWPIAAVILRWVSTRIATGLCIVSRAFRPARSAADRRQPGRCVARQALAARVDPYRPERPPRRAREAACTPSYGPDAPGRPTHGPNPERRPTGHQDAARPGNGVRLPPARTRNLDVTERALDTTGPASFAGAARARWRPVGRRAVRRIPSRARPTSSLSTPHRGH